MAVDAGTSAWLPQEPGAALPAGLQPAPPARGRRARIGTPEPLARGLPPAPELPSFHHVGPARTRECSEASGPRAQDPGTPSGPPPCRGGILLDPWPLGSSCEVPSCPPTRSRQGWRRARSVSNIFSDHNKIELKINNRSKTDKLALFLSGK